MTTANDKKKKVVTKPAAKANTKLPTKPKLVTKPKASAKVMTGTKPVIKTPVGTVTVKAKTAVTPPIVAKATDTKIPTWNDNEDNRASGNVTVGAKAKIKQPWLIIVAVVVAIGATFKAIFK